jgi:predicted RNase H-like nuclease (RuvC/YqgF family)
MYLIVGVDPGKTVGIACVSLNGRLISSMHMDGGGTEWAISAVQKTGTPVLVSTDKHKKGAFVRKLSAVFNVNVFYPENDISIDEKREIARGTMVKNPHERDAFASAMKAFNEYKGKLVQAESTAKRERYNDPDRIKALVVRKFSIDEALHGRQANRK